MPAQQKEPKIDPRIVRTRKLIEEAFLSVMEEKGFEELTVNDVTERAGINRATFYSHFNDKYVLLGRMIRAAFTAEIEARGLATRTLAAETLGELFLAVCEYVSELHDHCTPPHVHLDWILEAQITELSADLIARWTEGSNRRSGTPQGRKLAATAASSAIYGLVASWIRTNKRQAAATFVRSSLPIVARTLGL